MDTSSFAAEAERILGDRLVALYQYGSNFARGPKAKDARLLLLVANVDPELLRDVRPLARRARQANLQLRFDTEADVLRSADVFPVFTLELLDTKKLLKGKDVLRGLQLHRDHLRGRIEQGLRALHRDLLAAYVADDDDKRLAGDLRRVVRKSVYLLRALALVCDVDLDDQTSVEKLIDAVIPVIQGQADCAVWHRMRKMANFEVLAGPDDLADLYGEALTAFSSLVDAVDRL